MITTEAPIATSRKITITLPSVNVGILIKKISTEAKILFSNIYSPINNGISHAGSGTTSRARRMRFPKMGNMNFKFNKKNAKVAGILIAAVIVIAAVISIAKSLPDAQSRPVTGSSNDATPNALATIHLDRKFNFPLTDEKGKEVGTFEYVIQSASLQKQIIVQGQRATAVNGRVFLILNLKITNSLKQTIQLNTRDYLRLILASNSSEQLAPDIHNDPVEVQAISTKYTRVGVAVDEADARKLIQLKVGEIDGTKQNVDLQFKY